MHRNALIGSLGLHTLFILMLIWAGMESKSLIKQLPEATKVKLIRPAAPPPAKVKPTQKPESKLPETAPALEVPQKNKEPKLTQKEEPKKEVPRAVEQAPKELTGDAGTLRLQNPGFEYDFYLAIIQSKIEQNFRPPLGTRANVSSTVGFVIQKDGRVTDIKPITPSGNLLVDQAAERAIRAVGKFPPLPAQYEKGLLEINFEFVVNPKSAG